MKTTAAKDAQEDRASASAQRARRGNGRLEAVGPDHARQQKHQHAMQSGSYSAAQRKRLESCFGPAVLAPAQRKENKTGMSDEVKTRMETALNADFSDIRIHSDSSKAPAVGALAYTQGRDVHIAPSQFNPDTATGASLLGHELTHVLQQREGRVRPTTEVGGMPVNDDPALEKEADTFGSKVNCSEVPAQPQIEEDEELMQGKLAVQRQVEDEEELMQGKLAVQRQPEEEEELLQGKLAVQRSERPTREEPGQA
jgi:hypothetical protein